MKPHERSSVQTQFLIFTLFGDYILPRSGSIWTTSLLHLLELLGVGERAARVTLSRMARKGWLTAHKHGRRSQYSLTPRGWELLKQGKKRIFEPPLTNWDGLWRTVTFSLPARKRRARHLFRRQLYWLGFGSLAPSTWISPHDRTAELQSLCAELGITQFVEMFSGTHLGTSTDQELVQRCWDLSDLASQYQDFISRHEKEYQECLSYGNGRDSLSPETCFVRRFWLMYDFQSFPLKDPNLPTALLPPDWVGFRARELFDDYHRLLEAPANQFTDTAMGQDYPTGGQSGHLESAEKGFQRDPLRKG